MARRERKSDNVVEFRAPQEPTYWKCDCGCLTHYVRDDGSIECARCGIEASCGSSAELHGLWRERPEGGFADETPAMHKIEMDEEQEAFDETLRFIKSAPVSAVVILGTNGKMRVWGRGFETRAQRGWLRECLEQARKLLVE